MGLDMYLNKMPRYKDATAETVTIIESYLDWQNDLKNPDSKARQYTLKEWCGIDEDDIPSSEYFDFYCHFYEKKYPDWDTEKKYGWNRIKEEVGYWRKANSIHLWFVNNVQDGIDDCGYHHEVTKEILEDLLNTCEKVYESCTMIIGPIKTGEQLIDGRWQDIVEPGKVIIDPSVAKELLPTTCGFFFGGTDYDEYYVEDIANTISIITKVLETTDFDTEMIYYVSSW